MNKKIFTLSLASLLSCAALVGCNGKKEVTDEELLRQLVLDSEYEAPELSYELPTEIIDKNGDSHAITWTENSDWIEITDVKQKDENDNEFTIKQVNVTHPNKGEDNKDYTITASLKNGDRTLTKEFKGIITAATFYEFDTVTDIFANVNDETIKIGLDRIKFTGTIAYKLSRGIYVADDEGNVIFRYGSEEKYNVGDRIEFLGKLDQKRSIIQLEKNIQMRLISSNNEASLKYYKDTPVSVAELVDLNVQKGNPIHGQKVKLTGVVNVYDSEYDGKPQLAGEIRDLNEGNKVFDFYGAEADQDVLALLKPLTGKLVTIDTIFYSAHDNHNHVYGVYNDDTKKAPAATELTEEQKNKYVFSQFEMDKEISSDLPATWTNNGVEYDVMYSGSDLITPDGKVTLPTQTVHVEDLAVKFYKKTHTEADPVLYTLHYAVDVAPLKTTALSKVFADKVTEEVTVCAHVVAIGNYYSKKADIVAYEDGRYYHLRKQNVEANELETLKKLINKKVFFKGQYSDDKNAKTGNFKISKVLDTDKEAKDFVLNTDGALDYAEEKIAALHGKVDQKDILTNEVLKPFINNFNNKLVAVEATIKKDKNHFKIDAAASGIQLRDYSIKIPEGAQAGDKVIVYGLQNGVSCYPDNGTYVFNAITTYGIKVELVTAPTPTVE